MRRKPLQQPTRRTPPIPPPTPKLPPRQKARLSGKYSTRTARAQRSATGLNKDKRIQVFPAFGAKTRKDRSAAPKQPSRDFVSSRNGV
jgi:hypothetical protein